MTPAEKLAKKKRRKRPPRNTVQKKGIWVCKLREVRESLRISLADVAQAVGMSISGLWQLEHGGDSCLTTARKLAEFFGRSVEELWPSLNKE